MSRFAKIAPKIETPTAPPIWRKSVEPDVATPSISYGTAFWAARTSTCMTSPRPSPSTSRYSAASHSGVETASRERRIIARAATAVPMIGNGL